MVMYIISRVCSGDDDDGNSLIQMEFKNKISSIYMYNIICIYVAVTYRTHAKTPNADTEQIIVECYRIRVLLYSQYNMYITYKHYRCIQCITYTHTHTHTYGI